MMRAILAAFDGGKDKAILAAIAESKEEAEAMFNKVNN